jgi:hypothetical protein
LVFLATVAVFVPGFVAAVFFLAADFFPAGFTTAAVFFPAVFFTFETGRVFALPAEPPAVFFFVVFTARTFPVGFLEAVFFFFGAAIYLASSFFCSSLWTSMMLLTLMPACWRAFWISGSLASSTLSIKLLFTITPP